MARRNPHLRRWAGLSLAAGVLTGLALFSCSARAATPPNIVLILCDNLGYGDLGCYGSKLHRTPNVDRLAAEGMRLTDFYVSSGVCTPSRASIMTGCYAQRVDMHVSDRGAVVLQPVAAKGLNPKEITLAEVLKPAGYATALVGKWHLGDQPQFLPTAQGFDEYLGIPYSDDMVARPGQNWPALPLMRGREVIEAPVDRDLLTRRYTEESVRFITAHRDGPFFLMLSHAMPGSTPHPFVSPAFKGKSRNGAWGDSVEEIDWSTGEILAALKRLGIARDTIVIWMSDNGAPRRQPLQGSNAPLKGWGYGTSEGGMRVPCLVRWPGRAPAGRVCSELATSMDLLPTLAGLAGVKPPADRIIDGRDIAPLLLGQPNARSPHEAFYYYHVDQLQAVRSGPHKLYLPLENMLTLGSRKPVRQEPALYDLAADIGETHNLLDKHPDVVARLTALAERAREDLGDRGRPGKGRRLAGHEPTPTPRVMR
ncbi:MAG: Arylsulfatase [Planctomycetes bacterium ADurb.Bin126]|nr:MAG: Arylsulfatase [Planctomycetes bacterium ADurb.Bin126]